MAATKIASVEDSSVRYLMPKECAEYLRISPWTFYQWTWKPDGPPVRKFGRGRIRVPRLEFLEWADKWADKKPATPRSKKANGKNGKRHV